MKRFLSMILCAAMLALSVFPALSVEITAQITLDPCSPAKLIGDDSALICSPVSVAEALSYFKNKNTLEATSATGTPLALDDTVCGGEKIVCGDKSVSLCVYGDTNLGGKKNARDVIDVMRSLVSHEHEASMAADCSFIGVKCGDRKVRCLRSVGNTFATVLKTSSISVSLNAPASAAMRSCRSTSTV